MQSSSRFREWYTNDSLGSHVDPAGEAFKAAIPKLSSELTRDDRKKAAVQSVSSLEDLRSVVSTAEKRYTESHRPAQKWLVKFSQRVQYYGNVLDVIAQHHPEYVSLAWGAMKFLFTAVINHEALLAALSKGLAKIANLLPQSELISSLYPTPRITAAIAELYAIIIRFLIRAQGWLQESRLSRALHSITRPAELRYNDLLEEIDSRSQTVTAFANAASQAEIRDMRLEIVGMRDQQREANTLINELKNVIIQNHSVTLTHHLSTNTLLSSLQLSQILSSLSSPSFLHPSKALQTSIHQRNKRRTSKTQGVLSPFWLTRRFREWPHSAEPSLVIVKGKFNLRTQLRDFGVNLVELVLDANVPVLWVLKDSVVADEDGGRNDVTAIELLRHLIWQALSVTTTTTTTSESDISLQATCFHSARTETDYFTILTAVLASLPSVYIILDTELLSPDLAPLTSDFSFRTEFTRLSQQLKAHDGVGRKVRVLLITYGEGRYCRAQDRVGDEDDGWGGGRVISVGWAGKGGAGGAAGGRRKMGRGLRALRRGMGRDED